MEEDRVWDNEIGGNGEFGSDEVSKDNGVENEIIWLMKEGLNIIWTLKVNSI